MGGMTTTTRPAVGDVRTWDLQSDIFHGSYRLVEHLGRNRWRCERLAPTEEEIDRILDYYTGSSPYTGYVDPFGPGRRVATVDEAFEAEVAERRERAGATFEVEFVSHDRWAAAF